MTTQEPCPWCTAPVPDVAPGGKRKKYCNAKCKNLFHTAARRYGEAMVEAGLLPPGALRNWHERNVHGRENVSL